MDEKSDMHTIEDFSNIAPETLEELTNGKAEPKGLQMVRASIARARSAVGTKRRSVSPLSRGSILTQNHYSGRAYPITRITIHEMAAVWTADRCGEWFKYQTSNASSNYGIGNDGKIMCYVEEQNAAWTSANWDNDNRAITIEVSNSYMGGDWPISDAAYRSLVALCADLHKQYSVPVVYKGYPADGHTEHKMFANTACPGPYIHNLLASGKLLNDIKKAMTGDDDDMPTPKDLWDYRDNSVFPTNATNQQRVNSIDKKTQQILDRQQISPWLYKNKDVNGNKDAYQLLTESSRGTKELEKRVSAIEKKLDQIIKALG